LALLERVQKTKTPICITRRGKPIAEVIPPSPTSDRGNWLGSMAGTVDILGDIISPVIEDSDWEALRD
jgi:antitoxin (DNA-binding transcriptional repressor) of toxin-antitoxin stability system